MRKITIVAFLLLVFGTGSAMADIIAIGGPVSGSSWGQRFQEDGVGNFNFMAVQITNGAFEAPVFKNFSTGGWNGSGNTTTGVAVGGPNNWLQFDIIFAGLSSSPVSFDFFAFNGTALLEAVHASWNGGWSFTVFTSQSNAKPSDFNVPEPATVILLLCGVGLVSFGFRKR
jgi:hypothetical protein